jgi:hypothetical protein
MDVVFEVSGRTHTVPERQATILAENLRLLAKSEARDVELYALHAGDDDWRQGATALADEIEQALVAPVSKPLPLRGGAADATHRVLRLMIGMEASIDPAEAKGLRDVLGTPVSDATPSEDSRLAAEPMRLLTARELAELLIVLFALAVLTVIAAGEGIVSWFIVGSVIAALLGLRVATTRVRGKFAWTLASVVWWAIFLVPAAVLVLLVGLLIVAFLR